MLAVADSFLTQGVLSRTAGRHRDAAQTFEADGHDQFKGLPLVVLVDGATASGAEIVTSALQDAGRALVIGSGTAGLGTIQSLLRLPNGAVIALTWARQYAPSGYAIDGRGILPNICTARAGGSVDDTMARLERRQWPHPARRLDPPYRPPGRRRPERVSQKLPAIQRAQRPR